MKLNNWTVALAALGVVSLASAARAEEKVSSSVATALTGTSLSGYVDTSAQWNFGTGNANLPPYSFGGSSKADGFNLNVVQVRIEKPLDETDWAAGYRVDLWAGPDANTLANQSVNAMGSGDFAVKQAYAALRMPVGNGIDWKVGVFDTILGYESTESPNNPNFTHSYGYTIESPTHTGVLASYRFTSALSMSAGVANTVGPMINERADKAESYKAYMGSLALTAPDSMGFLAGSTLYVGAVNGFSDKADTLGGTGNQTSYYAGATVATPVTGLKFGAAFDYLEAYKAGSETWAAAGYVSFAATEKLSFHVRGEYLKDTGPGRFFATRGWTLDGEGNVAYTVTPTSPEQVMAWTATLQYDLWKNVISRVEFRWDHGVGGPNVYGDTGLKDALMLGANVIYKF